MASKSKSKTKKKSDESALHLAIEEFDQPVRASPGVIPDLWYSPDRIGYVKWVDTVFKTVHEEAHDGFFPHQRFVRDYLQYKSPYRGLLIYHGLGAGKTAAAIAAAEVLLNEKKVDVFLPKSLISNFMKQIQMYGNQQYKLNQHWVAVPLKDIAHLHNVPKASVRKHKRLWVPLKDSTNQPNFDTLTEDEKEEIMKQINETIELSYTFWNYRGGFTLAKINEMTQDGKINPFDRKVIIVDEAHNFISQVANGKRIAYKLYDLLMNAQDAKILLLSGTPMINFVHEISYMVNLVRGYETVHEIKYASALSSDEIEKLLKQHPRIHRVMVNPKHKRVFIELNPGMFRNSGSHLRFDVYMKDHDIMRDIRDGLLHKGVTLDSDHIEHRYSALPTKDETFSDLFIEDDHIKNKTMFVRRILGTISFFNSINQSLLPRVNEGKSSEIQVVKVPLSNYQLIHYLEKRVIERRLEENIAKRKRINSQTQSSSNVYKAYSRAVLNFAFPENFPRPYPSSIKMLRKSLHKEIDELDAIELDVDNEDDVPKTEDDDNETFMRQAMKHAMDGLENGKENFLKTNLKMYSPKFYQILKKIKACPGTALFYSQFREVEGLGVFQKVLHANGYAPFQLQKGAEWELIIAPEDQGKPLYASFGSDKATNELILAIFNSETSNIPSKIKEQLSQIGPNNLYGQQMKVLMITQSGSEGINLKNVREVHIVEPYWNQVRIDQVMGRAIRTNSHTALPVKDRNVDVFMYVSVFTPEQLRDNYTLQKKDESMTTDQSIYNIATRKAKIIREILDLMKQGAVDCRLHNTQHPHVKCFSYPVNIDEGMFGREINVELEPLDVDYQKRLQQVELQLSKVVIKGKPFVYIKRTNELYNYEAYSNHGTMEFEGYLEQLPNGFYRLRTIKSIR